MLISLHRHSVNFQEVFHGSHSTTVYGYTLYFCIHESIAKKRSYPLALQVDAILIDFGLWLENMEHMKCGRRGEQQQQPTTLTGSETGGKPASNSRSSWVSRTGIRLLAHAVGNGWASTSKVLVEGLVDVLGLELPAIDDEVSAKASFTYRICCRASSKCLAPLPGPLH